MKVSPHAGATGAQAVNAARAAAQSSLTICPRRHISAHQPMGAPDVQKWPRRGVYFYHPICARIRHISDRAHYERVQRANGGFSLTLAGESGEIMPPQKPALRLHGRDIQCLRHPPALTASSAKGARRRQADIGNGAQWPKTAHQIGAGIAACAATGSAANENSSHRAIYRGALPVQGQDGRPARA